MKTESEKLSPTRVKLTVEVPFDELAPSLDAAYQAIAKQVSIPGFRKGKVPSRIIDQRVGRAAVLEEAVNDVLTRKALDAARHHGADTLVIGGGFSANSRLRQLAAERAAEYGITVRIPPIRYCTDNGAMIAALGSACARAGVAPSPLDFANVSGMDLSTPVA